MQIVVATPKITRFLTPLLAAVAVVIGTIAAPTAGASADKTRCSERGGSSTCQRPGHTSLHTEPKRPNLTVSGGGLLNPAFAPGFGRGPRMPVID